MEKKDQRVPLLIPQWNHADWYQMVLHYQPEKVDERFYLEASEPARLLLHLGRDIRNANILVVKLHVSFFCFKSRTVFHET